MSQIGVVEFTEYIAPDGSVYQFDTTDRFLISEEGLGMPPVEYITQKGPYQHGSTLIDYRLRERTIQLILRDDACNRADYWTHRSALLNAIRPNRHVGYNFGPGTLRKKFPDGSIRDIKVIIEQGPIFGPRPTDRWDEFGFTETLRFIANDPVFYSPVITLVTYATAPAALTELVFPIDFPIQFSSSYYASGSVPLVYAGTWFSFPTIVITGPQSAIDIRNLSTNEKIFLDYSLSIGEIVTINLEYGNKTVFSNSGASLIGSVSDDSNLASFHIAPDPEVAGGINNISVTSLGNTSSSKIELTYLTRYIGI